MKKIYKSILLGLSLSIFSLSVTSCNNNNEENKFIESDNDRVFYEIFTSSFSDSNGDGIGDLKGICNRLDYLNNGNQTNGSSLGIQGIWLTPIFQSPSYHKYDATDYYTIDKTLGTKDDLTNLVNECHKRNIKLILDLAINHTATNSEWFKNFVKAHQNNDTESKWYDWYTWSNDTSDTSRAWKKITNASHYYECNFDSSMPELNLENASVKDALLNVAKYWLDLGVDGFRFDAAKYIYYGDDHKSAQFWDEYIKELKSYKENIYTVAEVWNEDGSIEKYAPYINCFNFQMAQSEGYIGLAARGQAISKYTTYVSSFNQNLKTINSDGRLISFQSNHDTNRVANW
jgi:glycosidase